MLEQRFRFSETLRLADSMLILLDTASPTAGASDDAAATAVTAVGSLSSVMGRV